MVEAAEPEPVEQQPQVDYAELVKADVIALYKEKSE